MKKFQNDILDTFGADSANYNIFNQFEDNIAPFIECCNPSYTEGLLDKTTAQVYESIIKTENLHNYNIPQPLTNDPHQEQAFWVNIPPAKKQFSHAATQYDEEFLSPFHHTAGIPWISRSATEKDPELLDGGVFTEFDEVIVDISSEPRTERIDDTFPKDKYPTTHNTENLTSRIRIWKSPKTIRKLPKQRRRREKPKERKDLRMSEKIKNVPKSILTHGLNHYQENHESIIAQLPHDDEVNEFVGIIADLIARGSDNKLNKSELDRLLISNNSQVKFFMQEALDSQLAKYTKNEFHSTIKEEFKPLYFAEVIRARGKLEINKNTHSSQILKSSIKRWSDIVKKINPKPKGKEHNYYKERFKEFKELINKIDN